MEEPKRKSFLDNLKEQLSLINRSTLTTRFLYIGEYKGSKNNLRKKMNLNVTELNEEYGEIVLTGFLLVYPKYFLHLIEASEEIIYRHLQAIFAADFQEILGHVISLPTSYNIYKLYFSDWHYAFAANPPVLLSKIEQIELHEIHKQIKNCLFKMYSLSEYLMDVGNKSRNSFVEIIKNLETNASDYLPEVTIIEYLLSIETSVLKDLRDYLKAFNDFPTINFYNDCIWPPPSSFAPRVINYFDETQKQVDQL
ncbi:PREDICTED: uncharacterized protein C7orf62 homolog [Ceratosolen solmsi marchali]|uniref:Uncharacterized protein C7orf62 homolog n=1 Tax=Ceratosolen solmsi marchali TaxID=326594 RepID=A0AAJ6YR17_9HYME|nr:PREDICTED: uncharacterized protein C7orf62 homolog [Ceratosolen solmsi marchali]